MASSSRTLRICHLYSFPTLFRLLRVQSAGFSSSFSAGACKLATHSVGGSRARSPLSALHHLLPHPASASTKQSRSCPPWTTNDPNPTGNALSFAKLTLSHAFIPRYSHFPIPIPSRWRPAPQPSRRQCTYPPPQKLRLSTHLFYMGHAICDW